jgi:hypothetical protein
LSTNINNFGHFLIDKLRILVPFIIFSQIGIIYANSLPVNDQDFPCTGIVSLVSGPERELKLISMEQNTLTIEGTNSEGVKKLIKLPLKMISKATCLDPQKTEIYAKTPTPKPKGTLTKLLIMTEPREAYVRLDTAEKFKQCPCTLDSMRNDKKYAFEARLNDKHFQWYREQYYTPKNKTIDTLYIKLKPSRPLWIIKTIPSGANLYHSTNYSLPPLSKSPAQIEPKLPGYTQLHIQKKGYKDTVLNVSIPPFRPLISEVNLTKLEENVQSSNKYRQKKWGRNFQKTAIPFFLFSLTTLYLTYQSNSQLNTNQKNAQSFNLGKSNYANLRKTQSKELDHFNQNLFLTITSGSIATVLLGTGFYLEYDF